MSKIRRADRHPPRPDRTVQGRVNSKGNSDDSIGRLNTRGNADDSIGRLNGRGNADDSIGRLNARGNADDSIGRINGRGNADDSIGRGSSYSTRPVTYVKGQPVFTGQPSTSARPITYVKGQPVYAQNTSNGRGLSASLGSVDWADVKRSTRGINGKMKDTAESLARTNAAASKVLAMDAFAKLPEADRVSLIKVMNTGGPEAAPAIHSLLKTGQQARLLEVDSAGKSVVQHMAELADSKRGTLAGDVLMDIAKPERIQQGYAPTCTASSMQYELAKERPGEYARLMAGLGAHGVAVMPGGGTLTVNSRAAIEASDRSRDFRTDSEAVFQSAVMEFANGDDRYNLNRQQSERAGGGSYRGLYPEQIRAVTGQLFGAVYETRQVRSNQEARAELEALASRERPNRPVLFDIDMGSFNHNVSLERIDGRRVFYRDPTSGDVRSLSHDDFVKKLTSVHYALN